MTLNRLYNFVAGQVIQSQQVNAELDQLITALNTYAINANFTSNNVVSDGDVVSAISALDSVSGGNLLTNNFSYGVIIKPDSANDYTIKLVGSSTDLVVLAKGSDIYIEDSSKTLDVSSVGDNQFIDIYVEEDTLDTPAVSGSMPIKLFGKTSGSVAYSSAASTGQYLIGSVYIKNTKIIGIHSLEISDKVNYYRAIWGSSDPFSFTIDSTSATYSTKTCYVPIFVPSIVHFNVNVQMNSAGSGDRWNYEVRMKRDATVVNYISERLEPMSPSSDVGRTCRMLSDSNTSLTSGLYTYYFGGKLGTDDASVCDMQILYVFAHFYVHPDYSVFDTKA